VPLVYPDNAAMAAGLRTMEETARALNITLQRVEVRALEEVDAAFALAKTQVEALIVVDEGLFIANAGSIAQLAINERDSPASASGNTAKPVGLPRTAWTFRTSGVFNGAHRQNLARCETGGPSHRAGHSLRISHQPEDCEGTRP
jgi:hypothetical protein